MDYQQTMKLFVNIKGTSNYRMVCVCYGRFWYVLIRNGFEFITAINISLTFSEVKACFTCLSLHYRLICIAQKLLCVLCKTILKVRYLIITLWISLEKGECSESSHPLGCVCPTLYIIRPLGGVYHFSLLISYPCS